MFPCSKGSEVPLQQGSCGGIKHSVRRSVGLAHVGLEGQVVEEALEDLPVQAVGQGLSKFCHTGRLGLTRATRVKGDTHGAGGNARINRIHV